MAVETSDTIGLDLAIPYFQSRHEVRDRQLKIILANPASTIEQIKKATKNYIESAWATEYLRSLHPL